METQIATQSAVLLKDTALNQFFQITGLVFWAGVALVGVISIAHKAFRGFYPKKTK